MLNYTNYAIHVYVCGEVVRFSSTSEGNTLLLCSFRIHALYLCPCFKLPFLDLRSKAIHNVKHKINKASSFQLLKLGKFTAMIILHFDLQPQFKYMNYFIYILNIMSSPGGKLIFQNKLVAGHFKAYGK